MKNLRTKRVVLGIVAVALLAAAAAVGASSWSGAHTTAASAGMTPDTMRTPHIAQAVNELPNPTATVKFTCQVPTYTETTPCYGPDQMRQAYGVQTLLNTGHDGSGRTIVIIDAYGSPTLESDYAAFNSVWELPTANLTVYQPYGVDATTEDNADGWAGETTLDVDWSHAIAPGANIALVVAKSNNDADILDATQYAIDHNLGDVISQSFGEGETCMATSDLNRQHKLFAQAVRKDMTLFASSGDQGAAQPTCDGSSYFKSASTPASDPNVTGVGGTDLDANGVTGDYVGETTWNDAFGAGGGGVSTIYSRPLYQLLAARGSHMREVPDVSYNASVLHGVVTPWTSSEQGFHNFRFGGTSAGSPQWAGIIAIVDQMAHHRVGNINPVLYALGSNPITGKIFHDVADGSDNSFTWYDYDADGNPIGVAGHVDGYTAVPGYDMATGLGSPNIGVLAPVLARSAPAAG